MTARRIVIDTDPGLRAPGADIDDGLALALALRSPEVIVEALSPPALPLRASRRTLADRWSRGRVAAGPRPGPAPPRPT